VLRYPVKAADSFVRLQEAVLDSRYMHANMSFSVYVSSGSFTIRGWCIDCEISHFEHVVLPKLLEGFLTPASMDIRTMAWIESTDSTPFT